MRNWQWIIWEDKINFKNSRNIIQINFLDADKTIICDLKKKLLILNKQFYIFEKSE